MDHFEQALKFIQAGRLDEARIYFEELLKQDPENEEILYNLGMLYTELGRPDSAVLLLKKCIEISSGSANAHVALGFAYMSLMCHRLSPPFLSEVPSAHMGIKCLTHANSK